MQEGKPSRTAEYMALFRALESSRPESKRLFSDPYANAFLTSGLRFASLAAGFPVVGRLVPAYIDRRYPGPRPSGVVRTRMIDDMTTAALAAGATQLVILGAGYDTRPYRLLAARDVDVFEVDHPSTQEKKRDRMGRVLDRLPANVVFVPVDFDHEDVGERLVEAGRVEGSPTFFIWEGVLSYLTPEAIDATLRWMAASGAPGSRVAFTYVDSRALGGPGEEVPWMDAVQRAGEPFKTGLDPTTLDGFLAERGLALLEEESTAAAAPRFGLSADGVPDFYRVALAEASR